MSPYGEDGHNGLDFHTSTGGRFFSVGDGLVTSVELNTGLGLPGTNYSIMLEYTSTGTGSQYHFEIAGTVPEQARRDNILVAVGDRVTAGQHIGSLTSQGNDAHVHFQIHEPAGVVRCTLEYFSPDVATQLENLYDGSPEKRSPLPDLCN